MVQILWDSISQCEIWHVCIGIYLHDIILPAVLITCQFLFCGTKRVNRIFIEWKKSNLSFLLSRFFFLCSFIIPFTDDSISFLKSIFNFLLLLIIDLCHTFSQLLMLTACGIWGHIKVSWDNHFNCLSCSSCSRLFTCLVCKTWTDDTWDLADRQRRFCSRRSTMTKKRLAKKKKVVQSDLSDDNSIRDGITTLQGSTARVRPYLGGISTDVRSIHVHQSLIIQAPVIKWWSPGTEHQSLVEYQALGTGQPITGHQAPVIKQ